MAEKKSMNKNQHAHNGNGTNIDTTTVLKLNTVNGLIGNSLDRIKSAIEETKAKIIFLSESNFDSSCPGQHLLRDKAFPGYVFEDKILSGSPIARISVLIS